MKKITAFIVTSLFLVSSMLFAQAQGGATAGGTSTTASSGGSSDSALMENTLIDFGKLDASDINPQLQFDNWRIHLSGLSDTPESRILSDLKMVDVDSSQINAEAEGETFNHVLGIRIHFAYGYNNDWAQIETEDPISPFQAKDGEGVLKNVGPIAEVSIMVRGMNFMHSIEVRMKDQAGKNKDVSFGSLYFNGWKRLRWKNPNYIADKRKRAIIKIHLYPNEKPLLRFDSLVLYKSPNEKGGDFVVYVKDVKVKYEPYFTREVKDIDNEAVWGIHKAKADATKKHEDTMKWLKYSGSNREEEYLKEKKQEQNK